MKNLHLALLVVLSIGQTVVIAQQKKVDSKVKKVTVFPEGAQVIREASTVLPAGKTELLFQGLSPYTDPSSVQVEGAGRFVMVSVSPQPNKLKEQKQRTDVAAWEKSKVDFTNQIARENAMLDVYVQEEKMLQANHQVSGSNTDLKALDLRAAMDFHRERLREIHLQQLEYNQRIAKLTDTLAQIEAQIAAAHSVKDVSTMDVLVVVDAKESGSANFNISYVVANAGWFPSYDLRVNELNYPIQLSYKANVFQNTGEEWKEVKLIFSNGNPNETGVAPRLQPLRLNNNNVTYRLASARLINPNIREVKGKVTDATGKGLPSATVLVVGSSVGTTTDYDGNYSIKIPQNAAQLKFSYAGYSPKLVNIYAENMSVIMGNEVSDLTTITSGVYQQDADKGISIRGGREDATQYYVNGYKMVGKPSIPANVEYAEEKPNTIAIRFELAAPYTVINDGKTRALEMKQEEIPANYEHFCVPKLEQKAYLLAHVANWEDYNLLDGEANLYYEGTFIGKTLLSLQDAEDTLHLSLGVDKSITVNRTRVKDFSKKQLLSDKKVVSAAFDIVVRNSKRYPIKLVVEDQVPVSADKEILVDKVALDGGEQNAETGKVVWKVDVGPAKEFKKRIAYTVKYPQNYRLQID